MGKFNPEILSKDSMYTFVLKGNKEDTVVSCIGRYICTDVKCSRFMYLDAQTRMYAYIFIDEVISAYENVLVYDKE